MTGAGETTAEALWYVAPGEVALRQETIRPLRRGEVRVRTLHSAVSRGTESLVLAGRVPPTEYTLMAGPRMGGKFPFPVKYGYAAVGRVEAGADYLVGRHVFVLHPHQTCFNVARDFVSVLPDGLPPARAVLAANMETALNATWDAPPNVADRIAVVGGGVVGALVAWLCGQIPGAHVTLVDIDPARAALARALNVNFALPDDAPEYRDLVFHASASAAGLATALRLAGLEATIAELSWYGAGDVPAPLGGAFHSLRLRLVSSQVGRIPRLHSSRWSYSDRMAAALKLLRDAALDALLEPPITLQEAPRRLPAILAPGSGVLCQRIDYPA